MRSHGSVAPADRDQVRVYVELPGDLDVALWTRRHAQGRVPDATPYGLHQLADQTTSVGFRHPLRLERSKRLLGRVRGRLEGLDLVSEVADLRGAMRATADIRLAMDERSGIPAALTPGPPVVSGVAWLEDPTHHPRWYSALAAHALGRTEAVFTQCTAMVDPVVRGFGMPRDRVFAIRLGIDATYFRPAPFPSGPPMVFSVGDDRMRDHDPLVAAVAHARKQVPQLRLELATTLPILMPPDVGVIHRRRMDEAVRDCYARASLVAIALKPTRQGSGLTVILEAMASGRPLVVTDNPGLDQYVEHGVTGLLVPQGDVRAMADAVQALAGDPHRAATMGAAARRRVEEEFTSGHMADDLRHVVYTALHRARSRAQGHQA